MTDILAGLEGVVCMIDDENLPNPWVICDMKEPRNATEVRGTTKKLNLQ